ncbi:ATP-binding cassette domain-containing protein [Paenibacillus sp. ACRRX]|uniref:ABC-F family ATP-binding cassette domain-containing protein n=1 Tax=Paenibacillus sp. ACRRX TaxID=2918206 RepID=UPI001EF599E5|nr:ABC-F family ATP-binding cassette domain-containing protein [Paenibacillus sp. ACRRX]MCG7410519.1 ATP-binding cassette domain-containing protein [Paenibacillus sp. ACRRX]
MTLLIEARQLRIGFGDRILFENDEILKLYEGECIGIVGVNGAGKSSLLRVMSGELEPEQGSVIRYGSCSVVTQWDDRSIGEASPELDRLSGGEWTKHKLKLLYQSKAPIWFLDEPTSHLDVQAIEEMERMVKKHRGLVVIISHDRMCLNRVCTKIWEVENKQLYSYAGRRPGAYEAYRQEKSRLYKEQLHAYERNEEEKSRLLEAMVDKKEHAKRVGKAPNTNRLTSKEIRSAKPHFNRKQAKVDKTVKALEQRIAQLPQLERPYEQPELIFDLAFHEAIHSKIVIEARELAIGIENTERTLVQPSSFRIRPGMRIAITGPNGAGKTSLIRVLHDTYKRVRLDGDKQRAAYLTAAEGLQLDGELQYAPKVNIAYFDQLLLGLDAEANAVQNVLTSSRYPEHMVRTALARLNLAGNRALQPLSYLSGGERVKVLLVKLFLSEANLLILDEPTNYLDMEACEQLEVLLKQYPGTLIFVSHDRMFTSEVATHELRLDGGSLHIMAWGETHQDPILSNNSTLNSSAADNRDSCLTAEDRMRFELEWSSLLARLSATHVEEEKKELERRFQEMLEFRKTYGIG